MLFGRCNISQMFLRGTFTFLTTTVFLFIYFLFLLWVTSGGAQDLFLALYSESTPDNVYGTVWNADDKTQVGCMSPTSCTVSLAPCHFFKAEQF